MQCPHHLQNAFNVCPRSILELAVRDLAHGLRSTGAAQDPVLQCRIERSELLHTASVSGIPRDDQMLTSRRQ